MSLYLDVMKAHEIIEGPYKHVYVGMARVTCRCGWTAELPTRLHPGIAEGNLLEQLRDLHHLHVEQMLITNTVAAAELAAGVVAHLAGQRHDPGGFFTLELAEALVDSEPCSWDHNHSCQAHGYHYLPQGELCPQQELKQWIESVVTS